MEGIVLDSPYTSIDDIIDDNVQRFIPFLPKIVSGPVKLYFKNYVEKNNVKSKNLAKDIVVAINTIYKKIFFICLSIFLNE